MLIALVGEKIVCGHAIHMLLNGKPHLVTCAHLVIGATRLSYRGISTKYKPKFINPISDIAILRWYPLGRQIYATVAPPIIGEPTPQVLAKQMGDCGTPYFDDAGRVINIANSMYLSPAPNTLWRNIQSYLRFGEAVTFPVLPSIPDYTLVAADRYNVPAAYQYIGTLFPGDLVTLAFVHNTTGKRFAAEFRLEARPVI